MMEIKDQIREGIKALSDPNTKSVDIVLPSGKIIQMSKARSMSGQELEQATREVEAFFEDLTAGGVEDFTPGRNPWLD